VVGVLVLEFVDDEEPVGGFAARGGLGMGAEEDDLGAAEVAGYGSRGFAPGAGVEGVVEAFFEAADAPAEGVADGAVDDGSAAALKQVEQLDEQMGDGFVFAGLAGEDEEEFVALAAEDAGDDGLEGVELVVVERQLEDVAGEGGRVAE
jgi:hypothetical protein